jgi:hypothetical protein
MKYLKIPCFCLLLTVMLGGMAVCALAQDETSTEISGFYQGYRKFEYKTGISAADVRNVIMRGGGFNIAQNLSSWFAIWTQFTFYGTVANPEIYEPYRLRLRVINNLQGVRYQTRQYGPFRFYGRGGIGFSNFSLNDSGADIGSETKISFGYGGGVHIWATDYFGINVDAMHLIMGLPQISTQEERDGWDSGLAITTGITFRF